MAIWRNPLLFLAKVLQQVSKRFHPVWVVNISAVWRGPRLFRARLHATPDILCSPLGYENVHLGCVLPMFNALYTVYYDKELSMIIRAFGLAALLACTAPSFAHEYKV